jgi:hypothetical protein
MPRSADQNLFVDARAAKQSSFGTETGLLRCARNDGEMKRLY